MGTDDSGPLLARLRELVDPADDEGSLAALHAAGCSDGLPMVVPTPARLARFLGAASAAPYRGGPVLLAATPPTRGDLAALCVMCGCPPAAFGVVLAAVGAVTVPAFNLLGVQTTTSAVVPLVVVRGPGAAGLGGTDGPGADVGWPSTASTVGRSVQLAVRLLGGWLVGLVDMSTVGAPPGSGWCLVERGEDHPWGPIERTTVTVGAASGWMEAIYTGGSVEDDLALLASAVAGVIGRDRGVVAVLPPEVAGRLAGAGWTPAALAEEVAGRGARRGDGSSALRRVVVTGGVGIKGVVVPTWPASELVDAEVPAG